MLNFRGALFQILRGPPLEIMCGVIDWATFNGNYDVTLRVQLTPEEKALILAAVNKIWIRLRCGLMKSNTGGYAQ